MLKMRVTILLLAFGFAAVAATPLKSVRIVGGDVTTINQYPEIAAVLHSWWGGIFTQTCGSTILNTRSLLTAGHCLGDDVQSYRVRVGSTYASSGGVVHELLTYIVHPQYNIGGFFNNDIAILRTTVPITYVPNAVQPGLIAGTNYNVADNQVVWAAGWGLTAHLGFPSETLRHVQIWTINQAICAARYGGITINENMLCSGWLDVGGRDQCSQDSGGPLYHNGVVIGVCSFGNGCADPYYPGVNARVSQYTTWIQANA